MIPETKKTAVQHALRVSFGVNEFEAISEMTAGLSSALVFRIVVLGTPYLLRIITRTDAMADPTRHYAYMKAAADAGLAPRIWYTDIASRISITGFIEAKPFSVDQARTILPDLLRRLHSLPPAAHHVNYLDVMDGLVGKLKETNILPDTSKKNLLRQYERIKKVYPRNDADTVFCHNDCKPDNIIFDGERAWLVDWESAFLNDRYLDLAIIANFVISNPQDEKTYLENYFGGTPNEYQLARFFLMRQLLHLFYTAFLLPVVTAGCTAHAIITTPGFREFHNLMWAGKVTIVSNEAKQQYALVHFEQALQNLRLKRWEDSLQVVSDYHALL